MSTSFWSEERTVQDARPVDLLHFYTSGRNWRYAAAPFDVGYDADTYSAQAGVEISAVEVARNVLRSTLTIQLPWSCAFVTDCLTARPDEPIAIINYRGHASVTTYGAGTYGAGIYGGGGFVAWWRGYVRTLRLDNEGRRANITCVPTVRMLGRTGLILRYGRACQVPLYSTRCGVTKSSYAASGTVLTVSSTTVTATIFGTQSDGYWVGGTLETSSASRMIIAHSGTSVTLAAAFSDAELAVGDSFTAYPGCDHTASVCASRFANLLNYQGQPHIPTQNPMVTGVK